MGKYLHLTNDATALADPSVTVTEVHLSAADIYVDMVLTNRGITPADVTLPNATLKEIALNWAKRAACVEGAIGDDSPLIAKAKQYEANAKTLASMLSLEALGLSLPTGTAFGQISLGRG